jgi:heme O synthase-like polyprenyltransferase
VLPTTDESETVKQSVSYALVLIPLTLVPAAWDKTGSVYFYGAIGLGLGYLGMSILFGSFRSLAFARSLFYYSIFYLPMLGGLMLWDKNPHFGSTPFSVHGKFRSVLWSPLGEPPVEFIRKVNL